MKPYFLIVAVVFVCTGAVTAQNAFLSDWLDDEDRYHGDYLRFLKGAVAGTFYRDGKLPEEWGDILPHQKIEDWINWEQRFLAMSAKERGFEDSLLEKFVFVKGNVRVPELSWAKGGRLVLLEAKASTRGRRYVIWQEEGGTYFQVGPASEAAIQEWFASAGVGIPEPPDLPSVVPEGWAKQQEERRRLESASLKNFYRSQGITWWDLHWEMVLFGCAIMVLLVAVLCRIWIVNRRSKANRA